MHLREPLERLVLLRSFPLLRDLPVEKLRGFARHARARSFELGEKIHSMGAPIEGVTFIVEGSATLVPPGRPSRSVGRGSACGLFEVFLHEAPSDVRAVTAIRALHLRTDAFLAILEDSFDVLLHVFRFLGGGLIELFREREPPKGALIAPRSWHPSARPDRVERMMLLHETFPFGHVDADGLSRLASLAEQRDLPAGHALWSQDQPADHFVVLLHGSAAGSIDHAAAQIALAPGFALGFLDAFAGERRWNHAVTSTPVSLLHFDVATLIDAMEDSFELSLGMLTAFSGLSLRLLDASLPPHMFRASSEAKD